MIAIFSLIVVSEVRTRNNKDPRSREKKHITFSLPNVSFTSRNSFRKFPLLSGLHRVADGALVGVLVVLVIMSAVAFHSQYLWSVSFSQLEKTRDLTQRLLESTAILENYLLKTSSLPEDMKPTEAKDLIYLTYLDEIAYDADKDLTSKTFWKMFPSHPINHGY